MTDMLLIAGKDLRIERSSRVVFSQILPFSLLIILVFGMAISSDLVVAGQARRSVLEQVSPGLFWLTIVFSSLLLVSRSFAVEGADGSIDALRMAGIDPSSIFLGKSLAVVCQLFVLEMVVGFAAWIIYGVSLRAPLILFVSSLAATVAFSVAGTLYGALVAGSSTQETLLPLLLLPAFAPILLAVSQATESALFVEGAASWGWTMFLGVFALLYTSLGMLVFGSVLEES